MGRYRLFIMLGRILCLCLAGVALACLVTALPLEQRKTYKGYELLEVVPKTEEDVKLIKQWEEEHVELDFWSSPSKPEESVDVLVPPALLSLVKNGAKSNGMKLRVSNNHIHEDVEEEFQRLQGRARAGMAYNKNDFNNHNDIIAEMRNLATNHCPQTFECNMYSIGQTHLGEELWVLELIQPMELKRKIWMDSTIHAREWLATATNMNILDHMMKNYGSDSDVSMMMNKYDWYFMPIVNPDGYKYSWTNDRYQRKNRRPGSCDGVDLNRNYDYLWGTIGVSTNPCAQTYCGPSSGSEPETQAVQNHLRLLDSGIMTDLIGLVSFHTYGYMFMHPWGHRESGRCARTVHHQAQYNVAEATSRAIMGTFAGGRSWRYGTSCEVIYATSGSTADWAYANTNAKYSYTPELRGTNFVIGASNINPSFREVFNGIVAMVRQMDVEERKVQNATKE